MDSRPLLVLAALAAATSPDLGGALDEAKGSLRRRYAEDPMGSTVATVLVGAYLFYKAEVGHNPKVTSYYDALVYVSTNLSVGYSDIFAKTEAGKAIGTALMTFGPAMAAKVLDAPERDAGAREASHDEAHAALLARLDRLVTVLEAREGI